MKPANNYNSNDNQELGGELFGIVTLAHVNTLCPVK